MTKASNHKHVQEFLIDNYLGVLSTVDEENKPWGSAIFFVIDDDFNFYFVTRSGTRKYQNLVDHPDVSLTVVNGKEQTTVQMSGKATKLPAKDYAEIVFKKFAHIRGDGNDNVVPPIEKIHAGDFVALKIVPNKLQFANFKQPETKLNQSFFEEII